MSKVIAVWGAPHSGKTTFATKLARAIYDAYQATVVVVYTDNETPTLWHWDLQRLSLDPTRWRQSVCSIREWVLADAVWLWILYQL